MTYYRINEGVLEIPDQWKDRSVNIFLSSDEQPSGFAFVITRDELEDNEDSESYIERQVEQLSHNMPRFKLLGKRSSYVDSVPAAETEFTWYSEDRQMMIQHQFYIFINQRVLVLTATATEKFSDEQEFIVESIVSSIKIRD